jgi:hypothetical protein
VHWGTLKEKRIVRRWAKAAAEAAANERRALAGHESVGAHEIENENDMLRKIAELVGEDAGAPFGVERVCTKCHIELAPIPGFNMSLMKNCYACGGTLAPASVGATRAAPGSASDDVADPEPAAAPPTPVVSPTGGGGRRGRRFTGAKKDPTTVRGAARFIALGVPLICSDCDAEETSQWCGSKADANKPVCKTCYTSQVRRAYHSLASIVCILSALPVFVTDVTSCSLHSSPPPAATAPCCKIAGADAGVMLKSRFTDGAYLCAKCWAKEAPADRVCASCEAGVDTVLSWCKSKRIEGAPWLCNGCSCREVRASRFLPPFHANANARRSPPRFVSCSPRAVCVSRSSQRNEILTAAGSDVRQVRVERDLHLAQLAGRARAQGLHEVLGPGRPHAQEEEEVNVRILYFLSPRFPRSRRSFDDAFFFFRDSDAALPTRNAFDTIDAIDTIAGSE